MTNNEIEYLIPRLRNQEKLRVIALGDSISFGVGDHGGHDEAIGPGWAGRFAHDLKAEKFLNVSRNGARVLDLLNHQMGAALEGQFDLALVCIGGNDVLRGNYSPYEVKIGLEHLIRKLHQNGIAVALINLPHLSRPIRLPKIVRRIFELRASKLNEVLEQVCEQSGAKLILLDQIPQMKEKKFWHSDRMHPSPYGHQLIADKVRRMLSLPRRSRQKLSSDITHQSRWIGIRWLLTKGTVWVARRSIDLLPALLFLIIREVFFKPKWVNDSGQKNKRAITTESKLFATEFSEREIAIFTSNAYRATVSNSGGFNKNDLKDFINFPA